MPADPITPSLAAAWSNTAPAPAPSVPLRFYALTRQASNAAIQGIGDGGSFAVFDGVSISGLASTVLDRAVLFHAQGTTSQNGLYIPMQDSGQIGTTGTFDSGGLFVKTGLTVGRLYSFVSAAGETITNGTLTLTGSGFIEPSSGGTLTIGGPAVGPVTSTLWNTYMGRTSVFDEPGEATAGTIVIVYGGNSGASLWSLRSNVATIGTSPMIFDQVTVSSFTPSNAVAFDNTAAGSFTPGNATAFDNTAASDLTVGLGVNWDNTPPTALVFQGETSPVAGVTTPASPSTVNHSATLVAGTNYLVQVAARLAPVTVTLPDPGSLGQRIEIADITSQGVAYPITVNSGTKYIEAAGQFSYVIDRNDAVLTLTYTGGWWKIL